MMGGEGRQKFRFRKKKKSNMSTCRDATLKIKCSSEPILIVQLFQRKRSSLSPKKDPLRQLFDCSDEISRNPTDGATAQPKTRNLCFRGEWLCGNVMSRLRMWDKKKKKKKKKSAVGEHNDLCDSVLMFSFRFLLTGSAGVGRTWAFSGRQNVFLCLCRSRTNMDTFVLYYS